ncbi:hypothetical protein evm_003438 [Chilo suppressalis]|nr:hypothetical protein evm_003438 [Chilo suppressalis]
MSRRDVRVGRVECPPEPMPPPSKCAKVLYYTWRLCSVVFSHFVMISLVVAYCILGAVTFEKLEAWHEKEQWGQRGMVQPLMRYFQDS